MTTITEIAKAWLPAFEPPTELTVSEWAAKHRRLPETSAARGARWNNETCPYLVELMDVVLDPRVRQLALAKAAQVGASETLATLLAYHIAHRPCPILMVLPTMNAATSWYKERWLDLVRTTPGIQALITTSRVKSGDRRPASTMSLSLFPGGYLALGGGNSPNSFARWSVRLAVMDDADRVPRFVGAEGDPTQLLINRTTSYHDGVTIFVSTPVLAGGRIESLYQQSDQRRYVLPCPACGIALPVRWNDPACWRVAFNDRNPANARLQCPCGYEVHERDRMTLVRAGRWKSTAEPTTPGAVGFHIPAMLSPFVTLEQLVSKFLVAHQSGPLRLREFVTTQLAEGWEDPSLRVEVDPLLARMEDY